MGSKDRLYADIMAVHPEVTGSCNLVIVKQPDNSTVKFVVDCGLFVEIAPYVQGLVHVSELSWEKGVKPADKYKPGD